MKKFFELVLSDLQNMYAKNKLSVILLVSIVAVAILSLIPAVGTAVEFVLGIIGIGFIALGVISAIFLLVLYIKKTIKRTKDE